MPTKALSNKQRFSDKHHTKPNSLSQTGKEHASKKTRASKKTHASIKTKGSRACVWHGNATHTHGGLVKKDFFMSKRGRIVSKKVSAASKKKFKENNKLKNGEEAMTEAHKRMALEKKEKINNGKTIGDHIREYKEEKREEKRQEEKHQNPRGL